MNQSVSVCPKLTRDPLLRRWPRRRTRFVSICRSRTRAGPISKGSHAHSLGLKMISRVAEGLKRPEHGVDAGLDVGIVVAKLADRRLGAQQCDAASGTIPSSTAALVACIASSTRPFFSLASTSVEPPTRMTPRRRAPGAQVRMIVRRNAA
jgi:hypothetical protein